MGGGAALEDTWCEELAASDTIAGVSYSIDACGASELALPLRFEEPSGWYELTVYQGDSPCQRENVAAQRAGYGVGDTVQLDVDPGGSGFLSIQLLVEGSSSYYSGETIVMELRDVAPGELE